MLELGKQRDRWGHSCPIRQVMLYVDRLKARGHPHQVYVLSAGHYSFDVDERVRQVRTILDFPRRHVSAF